MHADDDRLRKLCAAEFALHVNELYSKARIETFSGGPAWVEVPVVGLFHPIGDEDAAAALDELSRRALEARARFAIDGPPWGQPLPTSWDIICKMTQIGELVEAGILAQDYYNGRLELLAHFVASWVGSKWDPRHPSFKRFARGMMADKSTPARLRENIDLLREYPPKRLPGLMSGDAAMCLDLAEMRVAAFNSTDRGGG